ncbi:MAG: sensor histidine kinase [Saccharofermentanales bacterium]
MTGFTAFFETLSEYFRSVQDRISQVAGGRYGWLILFAGIFSSALIGAVLTRWRYEALGRKKSKLLDATVNRFIHERNKAEAILTDLDVGILAYGSDGSLINYNPAFCKIMGVAEPPSTFKKFLMEHGRDNGLQAGIMLGTGINEAIREIERRTVRIRLKQAFLARDTKAATIVVVLDITQQEQEEKRRKEFVANVSHELRTPLTTIKTYSESLLEWGLKEKSKDSVRKDISRIHEDALRMGTLVENLLLLSRIDNKGMVAGMDQHDLTSIVRSVVDRMQIQAEEKNIGLECYSLSRLPWVFVDRSALDRVMVNIISNAIKYTDISGKVSVYMGVLVDDVYVKVADTGFGIDTEKIPFIFDRFYRVDMTGSRMYGGTGLGLSIAKELVELHLGDISVNSILGKGTEFIVRIPFARKLFTDAISYQPSGVKDTEIYIYKAAQDVLIARAREIGIPVESLSSLSAEKASDLVKRTVYDDIEDSLE